MTRQSAVERSARVARDAPLLHETMPFIAHRAIRNRGTIGGSLAHADPAAELPAVMLALDARVRARRERPRPLDCGGGFFHGGLLDGARAWRAAGRDCHPAGGRQRCVNRLCVYGDVAPAWRFRARRGRGRGGARRRRAVHAGASGAAERVRPTGARGERRATAARPAAFARGDSARQRPRRRPTSIPTSDIHASARYRRHLAVVLTRRALEQAFSRAAGQSRREYRE